MVSRLLPLCEHSQHWRDPRLVAIAMHQCTAVACSMHHLVLEQACRAISCIRCQDCLILMQQYCMSSFICIRPERCHDVRRAEVAIGVCSISGGACLSTALCRVFSLF
jgi:hypothetical protein